MISCYFDDSGKEGQRDHRHVVLAGYVGPTDSWYDFHRYWQHLLFRHGLPEIHMKAWLETAKDKGWSAVRRNMILGEFIDVIQTTRLIGFGVAVDADVWRALPTNRRKAFGTAQEFCFQRVLRRVVDRLEQTGSPDQIALFYDQDFEFAPSRLKLFETVRRMDARVAQRVVQISFSSARAFPPLQAADILAWHTRRQLYARENREPSVATWKALFTETPYVDLFYEGEFWDQQMIEEKFSEIEREIKETGRVVVRGVSSPKGAAS